jgi:hypothetical protein
MTTRRPSSSCLLALLIGSLVARVAASAAAAAPPPPPPSGGNNNNNNKADFFFSLALDLSSDGGGDDDDDDEVENEFDGDFVVVNPPLDYRQHLSTIRSRPNPAAPANGGGSESPIGYGGGGCYISAQALMCQGGGGGSGGGGGLFAEILGNRDDEDDNDEEDDDDDDGNNDDDNDGHSSMLSNASLRRSRRSHLVTSSGGGEGGGSVKKSPDDGSAAAAFVGRSASPSSTETVRSSSAAKTMALSIRGGGGTSGLLQSQAARNLLVTALVTLVFEGSIGHILEFLKIVKQTAVVDVTYLQVLADITRSKGLAGLWDGFCPWGIVQAVFKGAVFGLAYQLALNAVKPLVDGGLLPPAAALTFAGGVGGGLQGYVLSPTLLLKTRVMTNPVFRERMSVLRTTWLSVQIGYDICATEGLLTLMKGSNVFALKRVFDWSSRYLFSDLFESLFLAMKKKNKGGASLTVAEKSAASLLGGVFSTCVTLPLDVLVAKTQDAKKAGVRVSAVRLFRDELNERGWSGLQKAYMQGFEARLLHVCLTTLGTIRLTVQHFRQVQISSC